MVLAGYCRSHLLQWFDMTGIPDFLHFFCDEPGNQGCANDIYGVVTPGKDKYKSLCQCKTQGQVLELPGNTSVHQQIGHTGQHLMSGWEHTVLEKPCRLEHAIG